jgi:hypothetical protein
MENEVWPEGKFNKDYYECSYCKKNIWKNLNHFVVENDNFICFQDGDKLLRVPNDAYCDKDCYKKEKRLKL